MYRPAGAENEVGGDFYDAFRVAGGWMLVIGDVTGRGAQAASVTALARYTLRTAAALTGDPLVALATLNRALLARGDTGALQRRRAGDLARTRRSRCGWPSPATRRRCWSTARTVERGDRRRRRCSAPSPTRVADRATSRSSPGQQLVVVTDGIVEAEGPARALRRGAAARRAGRRHQPRPGGAAAEGGLQASPGARSTTTSRSSRVAPGADGDLESPDRRSRTSRRDG